MSVYWQPCPISCTPHPIAHATCRFLQMRQFWGQQQRFFKEMANASKVEFVVAQAKEALADGMSVVIGLQSTGESGMDKVGRVPLFTFGIIL